LDFKQTLHASGFAASERPDSFSCARARDPESTPEIGAFGPEKAHHRRSREAASAQLNRACSFIKIDRAGSADAGRSVADDNNAKAGSEIRAKGTRRLVPPAQECLRKVDTSPPS
jgi:hypothetical protein